MDQGLVNNNFLQYFPGSYSQNSEMCYLGIHLFGSSPYFLYNHEKKHRIIES